MLTLFVLAITLLLLYYYSTRNYDYWKKRNIKHDTPLPFFGNVLQILLGSKTVTMQTVEMYNKYPNEKVVGLYRGSIPELIIRDPEIIRRILAVDFQCFHSRGVGRDPEVEPILKSIGHADGDLWKLLRQHLTPVFTNAKLKAMFPLIVQCADTLEKVTENIVKQGGDCDIRELMARFTTEVIGACVFGIEMDSINNEHSLFRALGKMMMKTTWKNYILVAIWDMFPSLRFIAQRIFVEHHIIEAVLEIFENIRKLRNFKPIGRNDFIDILIELQAKGKIVGNSIEKQGQDGKPLQVEMELDAKCLAAQIAFFFGAGYETSATSTSYLLYELAYHPEEQALIQEDIDRALAEHGNKICYESISDMSLLYMGLKESMRLLPSIGTLWRLCVKKYTIPELGVTVDPGVKILIPTQAVQRDEKYYKDASKFKLRRFAKNLTELQKFTFLPFGEGPRACIGARLGEMQSLAGLVAILHKFSVEPLPSSKYRDIKLDTASNIVQNIISGLDVKLVPRNKVKLN